MGFAEPGSLLIELFSYFGVDVVRGLITIIGSNTYCNNTTYIAGMTFFRLVLPLLFNFGPLHLFFRTWSSSLQSVFRILNTALGDVSRRAMESVVRHAPLDSFRAVYRAASRPVGSLDELYAYFQRNRAPFFVSITLSSFALVVFRNHKFFAKILKYFWGNENTKNVYVPELRLINPPNRINTGGGSSLNEIWEIIKKIFSFEKNK